MRSFIAIELDKEVKDLIWREERKISEKVKGVKWVKCENLHITLKFLGDINESELEKIKSVIEKVGAETRRFKISGGDFGAFPEPSRTRVLFFGIKEGKSNIYTINDVLEQELSKLGFKREQRTYHPHITIGRVKRGVIDTRMFLDASVNFTQKVNSITLFKSTLTQEGPIYDVIMRGELR